jgi:hypothetical protein
VNIALRLRKIDLDYQIISLSKQKEEFDKLLYYFREDNKGIIELKHEVDDKLSRVINLYSLL